MQNGFYKIFWASQNNLIDFKESLKKAIQIKKWSEKIFAMSKKTISFKEIPGKILIFKIMYKRNVVYENLKKVVSIKKLSKKCY